MTKLVAYRLLGILPQLVLVATLVFLLTYLMPGSPAASVLGRNATPEAIAALEVRLGLDRPMPEQFATWLGDAARGDLGESLFGGRSVNELISQRLPATISLTLGGITVAILLGVGLGITAALRPGSTLDRIVGTITAVGLSIPAFWLGIVLLLVFAVQLGWFPVISWTPPERDLAAWARGLVLPSLALGVAGSAVIARQTRSAMIETLEAPYVQTLRAIGTPRRTIVTRYAIKNALVPVLSVIAFQLATLLAAGFVIERVFTIPGVGSLLLDAVFRKDIPVVQGVTMVVAIAVIAIFLLADIGYGLLNPRARPQ